MAGAGAGASVAVSRVREMFAARSQGAFAVARPPLPRQAW